MNDTIVEAKKTGPVEEFDIEDLQPWSDDDQQEGGDGAGEGEDDGEGEEKEGKGKGKGKPGDEKKDGAGDPDELDEKTPEEVEKEAEEARERGAKNKEVGDEEEASKSDKPGKSASKGGQDRSKTRDTTPQKFDYSKITPKLSWKALLAKLIKNASGEEEPTYQKPSRRGITSAHMAKQSGAGAVKPGDILVEHSKLKIAFVIDSSGSMGGAIAEVYANIANLLKQRGSGMDAEFVLIKFSNSFKTYVCRQQGVKGSYKEVASLSGVRKADIKDMEEGSLDKLFTEHFGNATNFSGKLITELEHLITNNYNILLVTDTDILGDGNKENFIKLYQKAKQQVFMIADSKTTFTEVCRTLKEVGGNITHL